MPTKLSLEEAKERALQLLHDGYHCGPAIMQVMWEAYGLENQDFLWAAIPFLGGIGGHQQAPCGAVSASAICLGLKNRSSLTNKEATKLGRKKARYFAAKLVGDFERRFGDITCGALLGIDFSKPGEYQKFLQSGVWKETCEKYVQFIIDKLYEYEDDEDMEKIG
jgi:C_GCAxxG_C_C family probable redox protein